MSSAAAALSSRRPGPGGYGGGRRATIRWSSRGVVGPVHINLFLKTPTGTWKRTLIAANVPNAGSRVWTPPRALPTGLICRIWVRSALMGTVDRYSLRLFKII